MSATLQGGVLVGRHTASATAPAAWPTREALHQQQQVQPWDSHITRVTLELSRWYGNVKKALKTSKYVQNLISYIRSINWYSLLPLAWKIQSLVSEYPSIASYHQMNHRSNARSVLDSPGWSVSKICCNVCSIFHKFFKSFHWIHNWNIYILSFITQGVVFFIHIIL